MPSPIVRLFAPALAASVVLTSPIPAAAQDRESEARLRKIEAEVRALQRKVFPGGDGKFFQPEIDAGQQSSTTSTTSPPSTTAVTDILARLDAIEGQLQQLTARSEENTNAISQLGTRLAALEGPAPEPVAPAGQSAAESNLSAMTGGASQVATTPAAAATRPAAKPVEAAGPSAERLAAVQAILKPQSDDAGDDEYSYGFRLWDAGFYPEARQQLSIFLEKYPSHPMATYGRNLMGRAYLDDGNPREAAPWFLKNDQTDKEGRRAGDSLLFLAESMIALKDTNRACIALAEFGETYPALATGRLKDQYEANRRKVNCS